MNEKDKNIWCPLLNDIIGCNIEIAKLLKKYANKNKIVLEINEKKNECKLYPLLYSTCKNDIDMVQLLIDNANKNNIVLEINEKNEDGVKPIFWAIDRNNL